MNILRDSQLVIFSPMAIFITFSCKSLAGFLFELLQSSRRWKPEEALDFLRLTAVWVRTGCWRDRRNPNPYKALLFQRFSKVYHAFAFKPITVKFSKFTNYWMLLEMACPILNSIDIEYSYQEKIFSYAVPCSFRTWSIPSSVFFSSFKNGV